MQTVRFAVCLWCTILLFHFSCCLSSPTSAVKRAVDEVGAGGVSLQVTEGSQEIIIEQLPDDVLHLISELLPELARIKLAETNVRLRERFKTRWR